jgi:hypothetical protein
LPEREVSSLFFLFSPPQAAKRKNATALKIGVPQRQGSRVYV